MAGALRKIIISLIVFSVIFISFNMILGDMATNYGVEVTDEWGDVYNKVENISSLNKDLSRKIENSSTTTEDGLDSAIRGSYGVLRLTFDSFGLVNDVGDAIANQTGVPTGSGNNLGFIMDGFYAIVITIIIFSIVSAVFRNPL